VASQGARRNCVQTADHRRCTSRPSSTHGTPDVTPVWRARRTPRQSSCVGVTRCSRAAQSSSSRCTRIATSLAQHASRGDPLAHAARLNRARWSAAHLELSTSAACRGPHRIGRSLPTHACISCNSTPSAAPPIGPWRRQVSCPST
jgi:hypothetical protein